MSDLSMYELEDFIWDDFDRGDDHIVPHPTNAHTNRNSSERDIRKELQHETTVLSNTSNLDASQTICQEKAEKDSKPLDTKNKIMEKELSAHAPQSIFNGSCDGEIVKDMPNIASDDIRMPDDCFKSSYATSATGDNDSYSYPPTQISQADLCFVGNNCENKESGDLLYYGWPDIGNFEDVDKMLRSCDSSFGLGVTDNDGEFGWFTSDHIEGTEEELKMDFKFPCPEPSDLKNILHPDHESPESNNHRSSCLSESKDELNFKDQTNLQKRQSKHHNQTGGKKTGQGVGNDHRSYYQVSDLRSMDSRLSANNKSDQVLNSVGNTQQCRTLELDYFGHTQSNNCYLPPDYPHQTTTVPMLSGIKSEHKGLKSPSPMGSSYASNQSSGDPSFSGTAAETDVRIQSQEFQLLFTESARQMGMMFQSSKGVLVSDEKQDNLSVKKHESQRDTKGGKEGVEIGLLNAQESSSVGSELDEISVEANSLRQLRQVTEQLDMRTKLCIRDSLYRLARSAEQRHNNPGFSSGAADVNELGGPLMSERTNKCPGFMDMETDTNPIDRSVAHLLFHRPSESLKLPTSFPPKQNLNHGSIPRRSTLAEKRVCEEEVAGESSNPMGGNRN